MRQPRDNHVHCQVWNEIEGEAEELLQVFVARKVAFNMGAGEVVEIVAPDARWPDGHEHADQSR